jgi:hypothetical protein
MEFEYPFEPVPFKFVRWAHGRGGGIRSVLQGTD